jgi:GNAT superfamily N-acetyltransferase
MVDVDIVELTADSPADLLAQWHRLHVACSLELLPGLDPPTELQALAELDSNADMARRGLVAMDGDTMCGALVWAEPLLEDLDSIWAWLGVAEGHRRRGVASTLLKAAAGELVPIGRTRVRGDVLSEAPGERFVDARGARHVQTALCNVLRLDSVDEPAIRDWAGTEAAGYSLRQWVTRCPDDLVDAYARSREAMNDAPYGEEPHDEMAWTADRVRLLEEHRAKMKARVYYTAAVHEPSGEVAGYTELIVTDPSATAEQDDTGVLRSHRGHGLGLLMKSANLLWLRDAEPQIKTIATWNAASNQHMLAVNHKMGFQKHSEWKDVALDLA